MGSPGRAIADECRSGYRDVWDGVARWCHDRLTALLTPLAQPLTAGLIALVIYFLRASLTATGFAQTDYAYF